MCLPFDWDHLFASLNSKLSFAQELGSLTTEYSPYSVQQLTSRLDIVQHPTFGQQQTIMTLVHFMLNYDLRIH